MTTQVTVELKELPKGSYSFYGFYDGRAMGDEIDVVGVLERQAEGVAEVIGVKGELTNRMIMELGIKAWSQGFKTLKFKRTKGGPATRWAKLYKSDDQWDYYIVESLADEIARAGINKMWGAPNDGA